MNVSPLAIKISAKDLGTAGKKWADIRGKRGREGGVEREYSAQERNHLLMEKSALFSLSSWSEHYKSSFGYAVIPQIAQHVSQ